MKLWIGSTFLALLALTLISKQVGATPVRPGPPLQAEEIALTILGMKFDCKQDSPASSLNCAWDGEVLKTYHQNGIEASAPQLIVALNLFSQEASRVSARNGVGNTEIQAKADLCRRTVAVILKTADI